MDKDNKIELEEQDRIQYFKKIIYKVSLGFCIAIVATVLTISLFKIVEKKKDENLFYQVIHNFGQTVIYSGPLGFIYDWFETGIEDVRISSKEELLQYQLRLFSKGLNLYFKNLLVQTEELAGSLLQNDILTLFTEKQPVQYIEKRYLNEIKDYLTANKDVISAYFYDLEGNSIAGAKYKNVGKIEIDKKLVKRILKEDNVLVKHNSYVLLLSTINYKKEKVGLFCQILDANFFSKILDEFEIAHNLFYLKNGEVVLLSNYDQYQYLKSENFNLAHFVYNTLTKKNEKNISLNINNLKYEIGVLVETNNIFGHIIVLFFFFLIFSGVLFMIKSIWDLIVNNLFKINNISDKLNVDKEFSTYLHEANFKKEKNITQSLKNLINKE